MPTNDAPSLALLFFTFTGWAEPRKGGGAKGLSVELAIKQNGRANRTSS